MTAADLQDKLDTLLDQHYGPDLEWRDQKQPIPQLVELCVECIAYKRLAEVQIEALNLPVDEAVALNRVCEGEALERGFSSEARRNTDFVRLIEGMFAPHLGASTLTPKAEPASLSVGASVAEPDEAERLRNAGAI